MGKFAIICVQATATWVGDDIELFDTVYIMPFFNNAFCIVGDKGVIQNQGLSVDHTAIQLKEGMKIGQGLLPTFLK